MASIFWRQFGSVEDIVVSKILFLPILLHDDMQFCNNKMPDKGKSFKENAYGGRFSAC